ncbi:hypothetical protein [Salinibaculum salinum]|uniref:hypothetical protein n=1 Tax=Salinibaculum salinum TaxID=3131996 RepID=UPI0030EC82F2
MKRRQLLGLVGGTALGAAAGCSSLFDGDDADPRLDPDEVAAIVSESPPDIARPAPIQPAAGVVESGLNRGDELLARLPDSLSSEAIPDEDVRRELTQLRERARQKRTEVEAAPTDFHALREVARFRQRARNAGTTYEALDSDRRESIESERTDVERALGTQLAQVQYAGEDCDRTLLLAARLEDSLTAAQRALARSYDHDDGGAPGLGQLAADAEYARAITDTAAHLSERHSATVQTPTEFTQTFDAVLARARADLAEYVRAKESPEELADAAADRSDVARLVDIAQVSPERLQQLNEHAQRRQLALALDSALDMAMEGRALEAILSRLNDDDFPPPETADRVREERDAALTAAENIDIDPAEQSLGADIYVRTVQWAHLIDESLLESVSRAREEDRDVNPSLYYAQYANLHARLDSLPAAIDAFQRWFDITHSKP